MVHARNYMHLNPVALSSNRKVVDGTFRDARKQIGDEVKWPESQVPLGRTRPTSDQSKTKDARDEGRRADSF